METNIGVLRYCFQYAITQELRLGFDWVSIVCSQWQTKQSFHSLVVNLREGRL